jgi:hypothetical protein
VLFCVWGGSMAVPTRNVVAVGAASPSSSYDAFVSYSHAADGRLAPALQAGLQSLAKPWYGRRALRVFRDKTSLSASPALWPAIERALAQASYFVLLASPEAAGLSLGGPGGSLVACASGPGQGPDRAHRRPVGLGRIDR